MLSAGDASSDFVGVKAVGRLPLGEDGRGEDDGGERAALGRAHVDAFNRDDVQAVIAAFDAGCEINEPPEMPDGPATGFHGHDGIREWMGNLRGVAEARFEPRRFTSNGDLLLCQLASRSARA